MQDFVHLHLHSEYSLLDGACRIRDIAKAAKEAGHKAVALTDHGVMYGAVAFYRACVDEGIKPIIGCEVYMAAGSRFDKSHGREKDCYHLVLLVENETGYKNLIYIVSKAFTEGFYSKPRIDMELLSAHHEGLIALSGCLGGYIPQCILRDDFKEAESFAGKLDALFGRGNFYLELQDHGVDLQRKVNGVLSGLSQRTGIPLVATNDVHYIHRDDADIQAVLECVQMNTTVTAGRPQGFETDELYYKSTDEMYALFSKYRDACENTVLIAERCDFSFTFGKLFLPRFTPPGGMEPKAYLRQLALEGLQKRIRIWDIVFDGPYTEEDYKYRVEYELVVIGSMGYSEYFLIVSDFVNYAKSKKIPTGPGRGSGAGSLVAYLIGITEVDPVRYKLLFESFLNPERVSMPDFDIDFCYDRRDEVIRYVGEKYGTDHVSQIVTFGTMAARAAVRDVGRALGMSYGDVDSVARLIPREMGITLTQALETVPELKEAYEKNDSVKKLIDVSLRVEGMPRHASTHAAGVVITDRPLTDYVPLSTNGEVIVTQFDMETVAQLGLLKFDFLALRYLTIIDNTAKLIQEKEPAFRMKTIPLDDGETYAMISSGKTGGMFQLESGGMRQLLTEFQPRSIEDIMIAIALYRPGPMDSIPKYLKNRKDPSGIVYAIPKLAEILDETAGCIVYQEQVMQIFRAVAGYSYGRADIVRRAIAKKKAGVIEKEHENFLRGAVQNGTSEEDADALFGMMTDFANYGFKKSHAAAYALLSYQTAYLKTHAPAEYYASLLTSVRDNPPKMTQYIAECEKLGYPTLPPDINRSRMFFSVEGKAIRFGLLAVKNVGSVFIRRIEEERTHGEYQSFYDFMNRMSSGELNRRQIEALIRAGAFDRLGNYRSQLIASYDKLIDLFSSKGRGGMAGQVDLFGAEQVGFVYSDIPDFSLRDKLLMEKESADMYFSGHLLDSYSDEIRALHPDAIGALRAAFSEQEGVLSGIPDETGSAGDYRENQTVVVCGMVAKRINKTTKNGESMAFVTLEDRYSEIELIVFPKMLASVGKFLLADSAAAVCGTLSVRDEEPVKLLVRSVIPLLPNERFHPETFRNPFAGMTAKEAAVKAEPQQVASPASAMDKPQNTGTAEPAPKNEPLLYLRVPDMEASLFRRVMGIVGIFDGTVPVVFYDSSRKKYEKVQNLRIDASPYVLHELTELLGGGNVIYRDHGLNREKKG